MHYAVPALLHRAGMLAHFYTDSYVGRGSAWHALSMAAAVIPVAWRPQALERLLSRREDALPPEKITAFNRLGLSYALAQRRARDEEELQNAYREYGRRFCDLICQEKFNGADGVYAFEGAALPILQKAGKLGITKILEQFIAAVDIQYELLSEEHRLWSGWESPYPNRAAFQESIDCERAGWETADAIICASDFVADGMISLGVPPEKLYQVPYGVETTTLAVRREPWDGRRPLRVLFLGGVTLRKGPQYLYQALKQLRGRSIAARLVGPVKIAAPYCGLLREEAELTGQVSRSEVRRHYEWGDLFVFPSICEGSATVTYEALAAGLPVITTPNAGSVVRDGVDGFIVPIRDAEALAARIELFLEDSALLRRMSENARARAEDFSWPKYEERLVAAIQKIVE
ncbi:MAG: glycosyltransferase family 4 protein [Desulfobaccales bacterium]